MKKRVLALLLSLALCLTFLPMTALAAEAIPLEAPFGLAWDDTGSATRLTWLLDEVALEQTRYVEIELYYSETVSDAKTTEGLTRMGEPYGRLKRTMETGVLTGAFVLRGLYGAGGADNGYYYARVRVLPGWRPGDDYGPSEWSELSEAYHLVWTPSPEYAALPKLPSPTELVWNKRGLKTLHDAQGYMAWKRNVTVWCFGTVRVYRRDGDSGLTRLMPVWDGSVSAGGGGGFGEVPSYDYDPFPDEMIDQKYGGYLPGTYFFTVENSGADGYQDSDCAVSPDWTYIAPLSERMFTVDTAEEAWTGSPITKTITSDLTEGTDYTVAYADNTDRGVATITITGMGDYTGTLEYTFPIVEVKTGSMTANEDGTTLSWGCSETGNVSATTENLPPDEAVLAACYDAQGKFLGVQMLTRNKQTGKLGGDFDKVKLLWLGGNQAPQADSVTVWGK